VLDRLTPAERLGFVLHDMFGMPFEEIAPILDRSAEATRQLAGRARRRAPRRRDDTRLRSRSATPGRRRLSRGATHGRLRRLARSPSSIRISSFARM
jgi:RNA polymerase sigma-70 factor (ECF subfamily)